MDFDRYALKAGLKDALARPLPGREAHLRMINYDRPSVKEALKVQPHPRLGAVLVLIYPKNNELYILLMLRQPYDGVHSAQISFPGGKKEDQDEDLLATALREAEEETGIAIPGVEILGELSEIYIPPSKFLVKPFVGFTEDPGTFTPDPVEVSELIEAPLELFVHDANIKEKKVFVQQTNLKMQVKYFDVQGHVVWGATAMMLSELGEVLRSL